MAKNRPSITISNTFSSKVKTTSKHPSAAFSCHLWGALLTLEFLLSIGKIPLRLYLSFKKRNQSGEKIREKKRKPGRDSEEEKGAVALLQLRVPAAEVVVHVLVGGAELVDIGLPERRPRELDVGSRAVGGDVEALPLEQRVRLHAPVLVRRAHHRVPQLHPSLSISRCSGGLVLGTHNMKP